MTVKQITMMDLGTKIMLQAEAGLQISIEDVRAFNLLAKQVEEEREEEPEE